MWRGWYYHNATAVGGTVNPLEQHPALRMLVGRCRGTATCRQAIRAAWASLIHPGCTIMRWPATRSFIDTMQLSIRYCRSKQGHPPRKHVPTPTKSDAGRQVRTPELRQRVSSESCRESSNGTFTSMRPPSSPWIVPSNLDMTPASLGSVCHEQT